MTDDEIRAVGQGFIDQRKQLADNAQAWAGGTWTPGFAAQMKRDWDFVDPYRLGVYVLVKQVNGVWAIDVEHIRKVCVNPSAFKREPPADSARISDRIAPNTNENQTDQTCP